MQLDESSRAPTRGGQTSTAKGDPGLSSTRGRELLSALASQSGEEAEAALRQWRERLQSQLLHAVRKWTKSEEDAEEIVSDAFQRLWRHRKRFADAADQGYSSPWRWLWEASQRLIRDAHRRRRAEKRGNNPQPIPIEDAGLSSPNPEVSYVQAIDRKRFRDELTAVERVIWDMFLDGDSVQRISVALRSTKTALSPKQVRLRLQLMRESYTTFLGPPLS